MTIQTWLQDNTKKLLDAGITSARLDCLILLEDVLTKDRTWILSHPEIHLPSICTRTDLVHMEGLVARRVKHEPLAYIRGKCAFYGREFLVSPATLQPRPESESIITLLLE
ncbi:peptide chain release factor N(5)-glutamine methyltransferase, partial [Candidatus Saccharibacteria bacterium]|nr:peptide chain release factor N(5)-glutamine methyltransferase [Candidatus Saccharibacteria bacterium]